MKYPVDHKANTRLRILQEAAKALRLEGIERMSIASVMAAAGLTVGGFYAHFKSKDDLIAETVNFMFEDRYAAYFVSADTPQPRETLTRMVTRYLSMRHRDMIVGGCPLPVLAGQAAQLPKAAQERFSLGLERLTATVAHLLQAMGGEDAAQTARVSIAEMMGALSMARITQDDDQAAAVLRAATETVRHRMGLAAT